MVTIPSPNVTFTNTNLATQSFREGQRDSRDRERHDLSQRTGEFSLETSQMERPSRLRSLDAQATSAESNARVARGTEGSRIRGADLAAAQREVEAFETVVEAIKTNDMGEVERRARMFYPNDPTTVQGIIAAAGNAQTRNILVQAEEFSKQFNDPRQRQAFIEEMIREATADPNAAAAPGFMQQQAGEMGIGFGNPPTSASGRGGNTVYDRRFALFRSHGYDDLTADAMASGRRSLNEAEARRIAIAQVNAELPPGDFRSTPELRQARLQELLDELLPRATSIAPPAAPGGPAASPAPATPSTRLRFDENGMPIE